MSKPFWLRRHLSCPHCGFVIESPKECKNYVSGEENAYFDCPRCEERIECDEIDEHHSNRADLSGESQEDAQ